MKLSRDLLQCGGGAGHYPARRCRLAKSIPQRWVRLIHTSVNECDVSIVFRTGRRRSAMGEYVPTPGEMPLSSNGKRQSIVVSLSPVKSTFIPPLALPTPSAFDYRPKTGLTLPSSPSFSLRSRPYPLKGKPRNISLSLLNKCRCVDGIYNYSELPSPSPSDYTTRGSTEWRSNFTLTRKGKTRPYSARG